MSQLILRPKPRQTLLRWLLLVSPIFLFGPILNLVRLYHIVAFAHASEPLLAHQFWVAALVALVPGFYLAVLTDVFYRRLQIKDGCICVGYFAKDQIPLSELTEVAGDEGNQHNDFREHLILKFKDGEGLILPVEDYEEDSLRHFLASIRQHNPSCIFSYSDVIPLESRGLFRFLIGSCEPDTMIVKLSKTPMQDMLIQAIKAHERNFWTVYGLLWLAVICLLSAYSIFLDTQWLSSSTQNPSWGSSAHLGHLGELLEQAETAPSFDMWTVAYLRLAIIAQVSIDYFSHAGQDVLSLLWGMSAFTLAAVPVSRLMSPTFLFVDSRSVGTGTSFLRWENVKSVTLKKVSDMGDPLEGALIVQGAKGSDLEIDLTRVPDGKRRQLLLRLVDRYAGDAERNDEFLRATNALVDIQFTDLWLESTDAGDVSAQGLASESGTWLAGGRYELESLLGYGGQGTTYLARSNQVPVEKGEDSDALSEKRAPPDVGEVQPAGIGRQVVVKECVLPNFADVRILQDATSRFQSGAQLLKRLQHDQIVRLWDWFIENGKAYLVLEYLPGKTLRQVIDEYGALDRAQVRDFAMQLCDILIYLHSQDPAVIHCDFAPDNLILTFGGKIKLFDFDVARVLDARAYSFVAGRPSYTPPEQFRGTPTVHSDLFALGANIHFLLTGKDPSPLGSNLDERPLAEELSDIELLIRDCLAFDYAARPASAQEVKDRLENIQFDQDGAPYKLKLSTGSLGEGELNTVSLNDAILRHEAEALAVRLKKASLQQEAAEMETQT